MSALNTVETAVAQAWSDHVARVTLTSKVTSTGLRFEVDTGDDQLGLVSLDIHRDPFKLQAQYTTGGITVPLEQSPHFVFGLFKEGPSSLAQRSVENFVRGLDQPAAVLARLPFRRLLAAENARFKQVLNFDDLIAAELGPDMAEAFAVCEAASIGDLHNAAEIFKFYAAPGEVGVIRRQAGRAMPMLAEAIAINRFIGQKVDKKESFLESLVQAVTPVGDPTPKSVKHVLTKLSGVSVQFDDCINGLNAMQFVRDLSSLDPNWIPKSSGPEMQALVSLVDLARSIRSITIEPLSVLMNGAGGKWCDFANRVTKAQFETRPPEGADEGSFAELKARAAIVPNLAKQFTPELARMIFLKALDEGQHVPQIVRESADIWVKCQKLPDYYPEDIHAVLDGVDDMITGYVDRILVPVMVKAAGNAADAGISNRYYGYMKDRAASVMLKGKPFPAVVEQLKKFSNNAGALLMNNVPDDLTQEEIEQAEADRNQAERQAAMQAKIARQKAEAAERAALEIDLRVSHYFNEPDPVDPQTHLRRFFGVHEQPLNAFWAPFFPILEAPNGIFIVPLTCREQLIDEGGVYGSNGDHPDRYGVPGLNICVGMTAEYARKCLTTSCNIVSFRERITLPDGTESFRRLACLELTALGTNVIQNDQFRGRFNGAVPPAAKAAFNWLSKGVANGSIPFRPNRGAWQVEIDGSFGPYIAAVAETARRHGQVDREMHRQNEVTQRQLNMRAAVQALNDAAGYDIHNMRVVRSIFRAWQPVMPKSHRVPDIEQYRNLPDVKPILEHVFPSVKSTFQIRRHGMR